tara:strand:- start:971 stop:1249 length:279 start_codon:yes stop_codon:yes gene_type:complete
MESKTKKQQKPKWFNGTIYEFGEVVTNPFSGQKYELNGLELSIYDFIMGSQMVLESLGGPFNAKTQDIQKDMAKGLTWFRVVNAEAYMILLD